MIQANKNAPDLDWSQIRETVKLLTASVTQVECTMRAGDSSINTLTESFTSMVGHMYSINEVLNKLEASDDKDTAIAHCLETSKQIQTSIVAFQFYDRLQQSLSHVASSLKGLSIFIETPERLYDPDEWTNFQNEIRARFTMESEKVMFDAILQGKNIEEAIQLSAKVNDEKNEDDDIELF